MERTATDWIATLGLEAHVEGGSFKRTYAADLLLGHDQLPTGFQGPRPVSTAIYFLLEKGQRSLLHRIASDELWHFYDGGPLHIYEISPRGQLTRHQLGRDPEKGSSLQCLIKAGSWFGALPQEGSEFCLAGCTVAPGFDFEDFELAGRAALLAEFPDYARIIELLTR